MTREPRLMDGMADAFVTFVRRERQRAQHARLGAIGRALTCAGLLAEADRIIAAGGNWLDTAAAGLRREAARIAFEDPCNPNGPVLR